MNGVDDRKSARRKKSIRTPKRRCHRLIVTIIDENNNNNNLDVGQGGNESDFPIRESRVRNVLGACRALTLGTLSITIARNWESR